MFGRPVWADAAPATRLIATAATSKGLVNVSLPFFGGGAGIARRVG
jgi:hypothetical protein